MDYLDKCHYILYLVWQNEINRHKECPNDMIGLIEYRTSRHEKTLKSSQNM